MKFSSSSLIVSACLALVVCLPGCADDEANGDDRGTETDTGTGEYAYVPDETPVSDTEEFDLPIEFNAAVSFEYNETAGRPASADLTVGTDSDGPLFQVFSENDRPFAVAGLMVKPLKPSVNYELAIDDSSLVLRDLDANHVVMRQKLDLGKALKLTVSTPSKELFAAPVDVVEAGVR
jgi:hypothetical protein